MSTASSRNNKNSRPIKRLVLVDLSGVRRSI
jgi:hypothetical protein